MKNTVPIIIIILLLGCAQQREKVDHRIYIEKKVKAFLNSNPDWEKNEILMDSLNMIFIDSILTWSKTPEFLEGIPFELSDLKKVEGLMTAIGNVKYESYRQDTSFINDIDLTILFILKPEMVNQIKSGSTYYVWGNAVRLIEPPKGLPKSFLDEFDLGIFTFEADSIYGPIYK